MKKKFVLFSLIYLFSNVLFAQVNYYLQYKDLYWNIVKNAKKYDVKIEKKGETGDWISETDREVPETNLQVFLFPGEYRFSVTPINAIGVKAPASSWNYFEIKDENKPIFYDRSFSKTKEYDVPIMNIQRDEDLGFFTIYGKDIFFLDSAFSLEPISVTDTYMGSYNSYIDNRPDIKLNVVERNRDLNSVSLSFDYKSVASGYYNLRVKNPGEIQEVATILIKLNDPIILDYSNEVYDTNYQIYTKELIANDKMIFSVSGKGFDSETKYSLRAQKRSGEYPFTSELQPNNAILKLANYRYDRKKNTVNLEFMLNQTSVLSGYYIFTAERNGQKYEFPFLFKVKRYTYPEPSIRSVKLKSSKAGDVLVVEGINLPVNPVAKLLTEYDVENAINHVIDYEKILDSTENLLQIDLGKTKLQKNRYALSLETKDSSVMEYFEYDDGKPKRKMYSETEIEEIFCGPIEKIILPPKEDPLPEPPKQKIVYTKSELYTKVFLPYVEIESGYKLFDLSKPFEEIFKTPFPSLDFKADINLCIANFMLFKINIPMEYRFNFTGIDNPAYSSEQKNQILSSVFSEWDKNFSFGMSMELCMPLQIIVPNAPNLTPYVGGKFCYTPHLIMMNEGFSPDLYVYAGIELFNIIKLKYEVKTDFRYESTGNSEMEQSVSIGVFVPLSKTKRKALQR